MKQLKNEFDESNIEKKNFFMMLAIVFIQYSLWSLQYSTLISIVMTTIVVVIFIIIKKGLILNSRLILFFLFLLSLISLSCLFNNNLGLNDIILIVNCFFALVICSSMNLFSFIRVYVKTITFFSICGVVIFLTSLINVQLFSYFPLMNKEIWIGNAEIRNVFFGVVNTGSIYKRNFGIFYEPGLFAFHLNLAIFLHIFLEKKINFKILIILVIGVLTTISTNGYITFMFIFFSYIFSNKAKVSKKIRRRIIGLFIFATFIAAVFFYFNENFWLFLTSKFTEFDLSQSSGSGVERWNAIKKSYQIFMQYPVFGTSQLKYSELLDGQIASFTPFNWFGQYGLVYGLICNILYLSLALLSNDNWLATMLQSVALLTLITSQNVSNYLIILILIFYVFQIFFGSSKKKEGFLKKKGVKNDFNNSSYI